MGGARIVGLRLAARHLARCLCARHIHGRCPTTAQRRRPRPRHSACSCAGERHGATVIFVPGAGGAALRRVFLGPGAKGSGRGTSSCGQRDHLVNTAASKHHGSVQRGLAGGSHQQQQLVAGCEQCQLHECKWCGCDFHGCGFPLEPCRAAVVTTNQCADNFCRDRLPDQQYALLLSAQFANGC